MTGVQDLLKRRRKAELQTIHQFWYPGESRLSTRAELERRVTQALTGGVGLSDRIARLSRAQRSILTLLLDQRPTYAAPVAAIQSRLEGSGVARLEIESAARMLVERGFVDRAREETTTGLQEQFAIPAELAPQLVEALELGGGRVAPEHQLSQRRLPFEVEFDGDLEERARGLPSRELAELVALAIQERGILEATHPRAAELLTGEAIAGGEWKRELESLGIGTIGAVSLQDFAITVEQPAVIVFQEWMERHYRRQLELDREPDTVVEAGVDLYIDIDRVASYFEADPGRLTRSGRIPKRVHESLRSRLCSVRLESFVEEDLSTTAVRLAQRLGIIESYMGEVRVDSDRVRNWRRLELRRKVEVVLDRFRNDHQGSRWSFHQEFLRSIVIELLGGFESKGWVSFDALVGLSVSTYLLELEERAVRETLRQRREEDFSRERLNSTFGRLASDLSHWIVHCLLPLGVCELGLRAGRLDAFRLTPLGSEAFGLAGATGESRILVNPDFEIMLFCEGIEGLKLELELARFGDRVSAERVRRYRVTRETMRRGVRSGLSLEEIRKILQDGSDYPLPDTILVNLRDWGKDIDWIVVRPSVVLSGLDSKRREAIMELLEDQEVPFLYCPDGSLVLTDAEEIDVTELLQREGWLVRGGSTSEATLDAASRRA
ncbi:MAG: helicase-associated domain-containing protein [Planctomycetes bacterium]|nr:helicase-associated domain-containing protein [Planctomycetota bacterium]